MGGYHRRVENIVAPVYSVGQPGSVALVLDPLPRSTIPPIPAAERRCLTVAVQAEEAQVLFGVVIGVPVDVVDLQGDWLAHPLCELATRTPMLASPQQVGAKRFTIVDQMQRF